MADDARFEDGVEHPLYLGALDGDDLGVLSALLQDAVFPITELRWFAPDRRLALLVNRVRREDDGMARHGVERVQSVLVIDHVLGIASQGVDRSDKDMIHSILSLEFSAGEDGTGDLDLTLAGDGAIRARVEALEVTLRDVTRPYRAPSGKLPDHGA